MVGHLSLVRRRLLTSFYNSQRNPICRKVEILSIEIEILRIVSFYFIKISTKDIFLLFLFLLLFYLLWLQERETHLMWISTSGFKILFIGNDNKQLFTTENAERLFQYVLWLMRFIALIFQPWENFVFRSLREAATESTPEEILLMICFLWIWQKWIQ